MKIISTFLFLVFIIVASSLFSLSDAKKNEALHHHLHNRLSATETYIRNVTGGMIQGKASPDFPAIALWKNIPFGNAPRFQAPTPATPWSGILNTTEYGPGCLNHCKFPIPSITCSKTISEDCLNLNVFSPDPSGSQGGLPVMFWIPGGRFEFGAGSCELYSAEYLAQQNNIVVVTINYRLGAFGGLTTANGIGGNFNYKDQKLAMQWAQANIAAFGGNPDKVTIAGESAGAMSVSVHLASPASKGLFRAAAMSSNPLGLPFLELADAQAVGANFLKKAGCSGLSSAAAEIQCLQGKDPMFLLNVSNDDTILPWPSEGGFATDIVTWNMVVNPNVPEEIPMQPMDAAAQGKLASGGLPLLFGNNANDSMLFISGVSAKPMSELEVDGVLLAFFGLKDTIDIKEMYPKPTNPDARAFLSRVMTDYLFTCANRNFAANANKNQGTTPYKYLFDHLFSFNSWMWGSADPSYAICAEEGGFICHAADLPATFSMNMNPKAMAISGSPAWNSNDAMASATMSSMWGQFVATGSTPNVAGWTPLSQNNYVTYNVQPPYTGPVKDYHGDYCAYYDKIGYSRRGL